MDKIERLLKVREGSYSSTTLWTGVVVAMGAG